MLCSCTLTTLTKNVWPRSFPSSILTNLKGGAKLEGIVAFLQSLNSVEHELYTEVIKLMKIILVMPATNAVSERSFSA